MAIKMGFAGKLYRLSTGSRATWGTVDSGGVYEGAAPASLDVVPNVKDISYTMEKAEADVTTRTNGGWRAKKGTLKDTSVDIPMVYNTADADQTALMTAYFTDATIALAFLDGDKATADVEGLWADFEVMSFEKSETLEGEQMITFTVTPGHSAVPPEWVRVTA